MKKNFAINRPSHRSPGIASPDVPDCGFPSQWHGFLQRCKVAARKSILLVWIIGASSLSAIPFTLEWYSPGCGSETSSNGNYILVGTIAQPDSTILAGGSYALSGGFWSSQVVPQTGEVPTLVLTEINGEIWISWAPALPGFRLEQTVDSSLSDWTNAPQGNPVVVPLLEKANFYRLCQP